MEKTLTLSQLAEAHLMNVQREISALNNQKSQIEAEIQRLTEYLNNGVDVIRQANSKPVDSVSLQKVFGGE
jgi:predicted  nucleic acid-binding Zn-ribbon protein